MAITRLFKVMRLFLIGDRLAIGLWVIWVLLVVDAIKIVEGYK